MHLFAILFLLFYIQVAANPPGRLVDPAALSLITSNSMRFSASIDSLELSVKEVRFYVSYVSALDTISSIRTETGRASPKEIARDSVPPYEYVWDLSEIPDQDNWRMTAYCDIVMRDGAIFPKAGGIHKGIVVDRNPVLSDKHFSSKHTSTKIVVDGQLDEWSGSDTLAFSNDNNTIQCLALWDDANLYFGITVHDERIIWQQTTDPAIPDSALPMPYWYLDAITLYLDLDHDHASFRLRDDRQLNLTPDNRAIGNITELKSDIRKDWSQGIRHAVMLLRNSSSPTETMAGYQAEVAISWDSLGFTPCAGCTVGFDLFNSDNDFGGTYRISRGWSGTGRSNNNNPSEWGNLVLMRTPRSSLYFIGACAVFLCAATIGVLLLYRLRHRKKAGESSGDQGLTSQAQVLMKQIEDLVLRNLGDPGLSLDSVAESMRMSKDHLRKIVKQEQGMTSPQYINNLRMGKAKELLSSSKMNISEIAFSVGYDSLEYFTRIFKAATGMRPSEYRIKHSGKPKETIN